MRNDTAGEEHQIPLLAEAFEAVKDLTREVRVIGLHRVPQLRYVIPHRTSHNLAELTESTGFAGSTSLSSGKHQ